MIYTLTLNPSLDYYLGVDYLESDRIIRANNSYLTFGGKGINVSAVLTMLGVENTALGIAAGFSGKELLNKLEKENIKSDFVYSDDGATRINVKIKCDSEYDINTAGAPINNDLISNLLVRINTIKSDDMLIISGSLPSDCPKDLYSRIASELFKKGVKIIADTTGKVLLDLLKYKPFLIKPNTDELGELFGVKITSSDDVISYAKRLQGMGALNVLVSRGKDGAVLLTEKGEVKEIGVYNSEIVSTTGCGDSMLAGFVAGYNDKNDFDYALKLGSACAAATAFSECLCNIEKIKHYLDFFDR